MEEECLLLGRAIQLAKVEAMRLFSWEWEQVLVLARSSAWPAMKSEPPQLLEKAARYLSGRKLRTFLTTLAYKHGHNDDECMKKAGDNKAPTE